MWGDLSNRLELHWIRPELRPLARKRLVQRDADGFLSLADNMHGLALVAANSGILKRLGIYERALFTALISPRVNVRHTSRVVIRHLLARANRAKLREAGEPLPGAGPFTLYRGVSGRGAARRVRGVAWTASRDRARWFARRMSLVDPAVFRAVVEERQIFAYTNGRGEEEFIILLPQEVRPVRVESLAEGDSPRAVDSV